MGRAVARVAPLHFELLYTLLLVSRLGRRFDLDYEASDDVYVMNDPTRATLFKRRRTAVAVRRLLGPGVDVLQCGSRLKNGRRVPVLARRGRRKVATRTGRI